MVDLSAKSSATASSSTVSTSRASPSSMSRSQLSQNESAQAKKQQHQQQPRSSPPLCDPRSLLPPPQPHEYDVVVPKTTRHAQFQLKSNKHGQTVFAQYLRRPDGSPYPAEICQLMRNPGDAVVAVDGMMMTGAPLETVQSYVKEGQQNPFLFLRMRDIHFVPGRLPHEARRLQLEADIQRLQERLRRKRREIQELQAHDLAWAEQRTQALKHAMLEQPEEEEQDSADGLEIPSAFSCETTRISNRSSSNSHSGAKPCVVPRPSLMRRSSTNSLGSVASAASSSRRTISSSRNDHPNLPAAAASGNNNNNNHKGMAAVVPASPEHGSTLKRSSPTSDAEAGGDDTGVSPPPPIKKRLILLSASTTTSSSLTTEG